MTEKDRALINEAERLPFTLWYQIDDLIKQADSEECRNRLRTIKSFKYHMEEYDSNML